MSVSEGFYANPPSSQINVDAEYDEIKQKFNTYYNNEGLNTACTNDNDCVPGSICDNSVCAPDFDSSEENVYFWVVTKSLYTGHVTLTRWSCNCEKKILSKVK